MNKQVKVGVTSLSLVHATGVPWVPARCPAVCRAFEIQRESPELGLNDAQPCGEDSEIKDYDAVWQRLHQAYVRHNQAGEGVALGWGWGLNLQ